MMSMRTDTPPWPLSGQKPHPPAAHTVTYFYEVWQRKVTLKKGKVDNSTLGKIIETVIDFNSISFSLI